MNELTEILVSMMLMALAVPLVALILSLTVGALVYSDMPAREREERHFPRFSWYAWHYWIKATQWLFIVYVACCLIALLINAAHFVLN